MEQPEPEQASVDGVEPGFRLGFVPGATPAKWARVWQARHRGVPLHLVPVPAGEAEAAVIAGDLDAVILRPPVNRDVLHAIPLYVEEPVVVVARDHVLAALEESESAELADLGDEVVLQPADDVLLWEGGPPGRPPVEVPASTGDAIALVAAGIGV
uniref:LysR family transcriptional regulator substrate-binding protein n=1 Tax=Pseudactinotalea sp. TaxID=1926260 RepID=UPI003B3B1EF8